jgi:CubicO group peptidase (beta-lactamase class C family)
MHHHYLQQRNWKRPKTLRLISALVLTLAGTTQAQTSQELDPARLMQGFPPTPAYQIHIGNWQQYPQKIWSFQHTRELFPTRPLQVVAPTQPLPMALKPLDDLQVGTPEAAQTWPQMLAATHVDAALVLHHGRIIDERYFNGMTPSTPHLLFSATKSMAGLMAAVAIEEGKLDASSRVDSVLPELVGSAWGEATVRQVLDMTDGVQFSEVYTDPRSDIFSYIGAMGWAPDLQDPNKPRGIQAMLATLKTAHPEPRGTTFRYRSPATDVTAWLAARATGMSLTAWLQQRIWSRLGMEHDGNVMLDPVGTEVAFAGLSASTRDMARLGQMLLQKGRIGRTQIIPEAVVNDLIQGGDTKAFEAAGMPLRKGWSYRSQWWINPNAPRFFAAMGAFGQRLFVLPDDDMVVVLLSSHPKPVASLIDGPQLRAIQALTAHFKGL